MQYLAIAAMWVSVAAIAVFGGGDRGFVALVLGICAAGVTAAALEKD